MKIGNALLDVSAHLIQGIGHVESVEQLRADWKSQVVEGGRPQERQDADPREFQSDVEEIAGLREEPDSYVFYVPGSSGLVRLCIGIFGNKEPVIDLADSGSSRRVEKRFQEISK